MTIKSLPHWKFIIKHKKKFVWIKELIPVNPNGIVEGVTVIVMEKNWEIWLHHSQR
jgi:hypothetical protein